MFIQVCTLFGLAIVSGCVHGQARPTAPLDPGPQGIASLLTAGSISRGSTVEGDFPCRGSLYFRLDNAPEGTVLNITLHTTVTAEQGRYCHRGSFPDAHDQYTYTALGGCPERAMVNDTPTDTPSDASSQPTTEQGPFYLRLWRLEDPGGQCVAGRYRLSVR